MRFRPALGERSLVSEPLKDNKDTGEADMTRKEMVDVMLESPLYLDVPVRERLGLHREFLLLFPGLAPPLCTENPDPCRVEPVFH